MKKLLVIILFVIGIVNVSSADQFYDGNVCRDYVNVYVDTLYSNGYIEVEYVDCDGNYQRVNIACEGINLCIDTRYNVNFYATPDNNYEFKTWSNIVIPDTNDTSLKLCHDLSIKPIFVRHDHQEDDSGCFISTIK